MNIIEKINDLLIKFNVDYVKHYDIDDLNIIIDDRNIFESRKAKNYKICYLYNSDDNIKKLISGIESYYLYEDLDKYIHSTHINFGHYETICENMFNKHNQDIDLLSDKEFENLSNFLFEEFDIKIDRIICLLIS